MNVKEAEALLIDKLRRKHLALQTEKSYCHWLRRYAAFLAKDREGGETPVLFRTEWPQSNNLLFYGGRQALQQARHSRSKSFSNASATLHQLSSSQSPQHQ